MTMFDQARPSLRELASDVRERLRERARHPDQILEGRRLFYLRHGGACGEEGYGRSELAFLSWLLRRGSLGGFGRPRSLWWSGVHFDLAFDSELAAAIVEHRLTRSADLPEAVRPWLAYLAHPSALTWYRAHNDSIVRSSLARAHEARTEPLLEQRFIGRVLTRVMCVQAIHELGDQLPVLARYADPRSNLVERVLGMRLLYPEPYPIARFSFDGAAQSAMHAVETLVWRVGLDALFRAAAVRGRREFLTARELTLSFPSSAASHQGRPSGARMREIRKGEMTLTEGHTSKRPIATAVICGVASGLALGAIVGPVGVLFGGALGVAAGIFSGYVLAKDEAKRSRRMRELDAIIGITTGSIGLGPIAISQIEEDDDAPIYSSREAWAAEWLTPPPPSVR